MARSFLTLATAALATTAVLAAVEAPAGNFVDGACVAGYDASSDASVDLFPSKAVPGSDFKDKVSSDYSLLWDVTYHKHYKVINATNAALVDSNAVKYAVLYQCGTPQPDLSATLGTAGVKYYSIPITKAAVASTTYLPLLEILGERKAIVAYTSSFAYVTSPCLNKMKIDGTTNEVTGDWPTRNTELTRLGVQVTFSDTYNPAALNAWVMTNIKETSAAASALFGGTSATLQGAEYIKLVSLFFNREAEANAAFSTIANRYLCTVKDVQAAVAAAGATTPKVLWASYYAGGWSVGTCPNYYCEVIKAAGGEMIEYTGMVGDVVTSWGSKYLSTAQLLTKAKDADVWFHAGNWSTRGGTQFTAGHRDVKAVKNGRVFDTNGRGSNDWFESRVAEPDVFLRDIASALWPNHASLGKRDGRGWIRHQDEWVNERREEVCTDTGAAHTLSGDGHAWCPETKTSQEVMFMETPVGIMVIALAAILALVVAVTVVAFVVAAVVLIKVKNGANASGKAVLPTVAVSEKAAVEVELAPVASVTVVA